MTEFMTTLLFLVLPYAWGCWVGYKYGRFVEAMSHEDNPR